jgi:hypothetical protein
VAIVNKQEKDMTHVTQMPFVKMKGAEVESLWSVVETADFESDCKTGRDYAALLLPLLPNSRSLLGQIVKEMPRKFSGIECGFWQEIADAI